MLRAGSSQIKGKETEQGQAETEYADLGRVETQCVTMGAETVSSAAAQFFEQVNAVDVNGSNGMHGGCDHRHDE